MTSAPRLRLFSSCPAPSGGTPDRHFREALESARWADAAGHDAVLIDSHNQLGDAWTLAQLILHETERIAPIVTVQPLYCHPYSVAKKVATLARLYGRTPHLNLAVGAYRADLLSLGDPTPHDARYDRLVEFGTIVRQLLASSDPVIFDGHFYRIHKPAALAPLPESRQPQLFLCSASDRGQTAAREIDALLIRQATEAGASAPCVRLGLIARESDEAAWDAAHRRFPTNPAARFARRLEMAWTDSQSHSQLHAAASEPATAPAESRLWLAPFEHRQAQCAYIVGSHAETARLIRTWMNAGTHTFLLDAPAGEQDLEHTRTVFERAWKRYRSPLAVSA